MDSRCRLEPGIGFQRVGSGCSRRSVHIVPFQMFHQISWADSLFWYIEVFYNRQRLHATLGYQSPATYLAQWHHDK